MQFAYKLKTNTRFSSFRRRRHEDCCTYQFEKNSEYGEISRDLDRKSIRPHPRQRKNLFHASQVTSRDVSKKRHGGKCVWTHCQFEKKSTSSVDFQHINRQPDMLIMTMSSSFLRVRWGMRGNSCVEIAFHPKNNRVVQYMSQGRRAAWSGHQTSGKRERERDQRENKIDFWFSLIFISCSAHTARNDKKRAQLEWSLFAFSPVCVCKWVSVLATSLSLPFFVTDICEQRKNTPVQMCQWIITVVNWCSICTPICTVIWHSKMNSLALTVGLLDNGNHMCL